MSIVTPLTQVIILMFTGYDIDSPLLLRYGRLCIQFDSYNIDLKDRFETEEIFKKINLK